ncbi:hypothetical protein ACH4TX_06400 [Streptomyces sp. NPDC021098]|uniref:hypothetical protein n=1 Tax=unclassified Streptomyces TaxID=2593676 RepID=UPI0037B6036A
MFIPPNALSGSRRHRLIVGGMLTSFMALMGVTLSIVAANTTDSPLPMSGFAAVALSAFAIAWWCARYWYAALRGTPEPQESWPWLLLPLVFVAIFVVSGIGALQDGKQSAAIFMPVMAVLFSLPLAAGWLAGLMVHRKDRSGRRQGPAPVQNTPEPQRPYRAWGPID